MVRVRYFASLRERRGTDVEDVALRPGETLGELYLRLFPAGPAGVPYWSRKMGACGRVLPSTTWQRQASGFRRVSKCRNS